MINKLFLSLLITITATAYAQEKQQYLLFSGSGGLHNISYKLQDSEQKGSFGYMFNAGYTRFLFPDWGIVTGLGIQSAQPRATLNFMDGTPAIDTDGDNYEYRTYFNDWKEKQQTLFLNIPVGVQYKYIFEKFDLLASAGAKISIPVKARYTVTAGEIVTTGYYEQWNVELTDMPQHGFSTVTSRPAGDISIKPSFSVFTDIGGVYKLSEILGIYFGGYLSYGLNNVLNANNLPIYQDDGTYNGTLASDQVDEASLLSLGFNIGVRLQIGIEKAQKKPKIGLTTREKQYKQAREIASGIEILFDLSSDQPINLPEEELKTLAGLLKENPGMKLRIVGHTCDIASRDVNLKVGMDRANTVKDKLVEFGVSPAQLVTETKASDEPLVPNTSEKNRARNRRVELFVE